MKIYLLHDPKKHDECLRYSHLGTWSEGYLCKKCQQSTTILIEPLLIEWETSDTINICDFVWCGYTPILKESIGLLLINKYGVECKLGTVELAKNVKYTKKKPLPPFNISLFKWLMSTEKVCLDLGKSGIDKIIDCTLCGQQRYKFKTEGIVINREDWHGEKIFRIQQFGKSAALFITDEGVEIFKNLNIHNVKFTEAGAII